VKRTKHLVSKENNEYAPINLDEGRERKKNLSTTSEKSQAVWTGKGSITEKRQGGGSSKNFDTVKNRKPEVTSVTRRKMAEKRKEDVSMADEKHDLASRHEKWSRKSKDAGKGLLGLCEKDRIGQSGGRDAGVR